MCRWWRRSNLGIKIIPALYQWISVESQSFVFRWSFYYNEGKLYIFIFNYYYYFTDFDVNFHTYLQDPWEYLINFRCHLTDGSAAICFGKMWELHNHLENGQIGSVLWIPTFKNDEIDHKNKILSIHNQDSAINDDESKNLSLPFNQISCILMEFLLILWFLCSFFWGFHCA